MRYITQYKKLSLLLITIASIMFAIDTSAQQFGFVTRIGNTPVSLNDIAGDEDSDAIYVTGQYSGNAQVGSESFSNTQNGDAYLVSIAKDGDANWAVNTTGSGSYEGTVVETDASGNVIYGGYGTSDINIGGTVITNLGNNDAFIAKYTSRGIQQWAVGINGTGDIELWAINTDSEGNIYVGGLFSGDINFRGSNISSTGGIDMYIAKFDRNGNEVWIKQSNGASSEHCTSIAVDNSDNLYLTGFFRGNADFGSTTLTSNGDLDYYICKMDNNGNFIWAIDEGSGSEEIGHDITVDRNGDIVLAFATASNPVSISGNSKATNGLYDIGLAKYDTDGNFLWYEIYGGSQNDEPRGVGTDRNGDIYVAGFANDDITVGLETFSNSGGQDIFAFKVTSSGTFEWGKMQAAGGNSGSNGIYVDTYATAFLGGSFIGAINFDGSVSTAAGGSNAFVTNLFIPTVPDITSTSVSSTDPYTANVSSALNSEGNSSIRRMGFVWGTSPNPDISLPTKVAIDPELGSFEYLIENLTFETTYYVRSFATNSQGTTYGEERQFRTGSFSVAVDGNQDYIMDTLQNYVVTRLSPVTNKYITAQSLDTNLTVSNLYIERFAEQNYIYPYGRIGFDIVGSSATVKLIFHDEQQEQEYIYRKTDNRGATKEFVNAEYSVENIGGSEAMVITLTLFDGGDGDADNTVNGIIKDPGGPSILSPTAVVPLWDFNWVLFLALSGYAYYRFR